MGSGAGSSLTDRLLARFNEWFCSGNGVWQTFLVVLVIVVLEQVFPHVDPHGFAVLYGLTVYSGITQPALAYAGRKSAEDIERLQLHLEALMEAHGVEKPDEASLS